MDPKVQKEIEKRICNELGLETLETRNSDGLDFHEISVWALRKIIEDVYAEGYAQGQLDSH